MSELFRVLRPGGWAILETPVDWSREDTFEDWSVTDPKGRTQLFGQPDHVRLYGRNFPGLLTDAGWEVHLDPLELTPAEQRRTGTRVKVDRVFYCVKPA
jgi:hypothetical protein